MFSLSGKHDGSDKFGSVVRRCWVPSTATIDSDAGDRRLNTSVGAVRSLCLRLVVRAPQPPTAHSQDQEHEEDYLGVRAPKKSVAWSWHISSRTSAQGAERAGGLEQTTREVQGVIHWWIRWQRAGVSGAEVATNSLVGTRTALKVSPTRRASNSGAIDTNWWVVPKMTGYSTSCAGADGIHHCPRRDRHPKGRNRRKSCVRELAHDHPI